MTLATKRLNSRTACVNTTIFTRVHAHFNTDGGAKQTIEVKNRGFGFLVPIGKMLTQHEEKNDVRCTPIIWFVYFY